MIKKIITFTFFLILISINKNIFAAENENCPIEKKTPEFLSEYIKNVRIVEKNMLENLSDLKVKDFK
jgi:predicted nucleotide-binding protein (sugar kinase/HSP70/actin superfamily)